MLKKVRLGVTLAVLGVAGLYALYTYFFGTGELVLVAPPHIALSVALDGAAPVQIAPGQHQVLPLPIGQHAVALTSGDERVERTVDIKSGFARYLLPAAKQCFVELDVSNSNYDSGEAPTLVRRITSGELADMPGSRYFSLNDLPATKKKRRSVYLVLEAHCADLELSDQELLKSVDY